MVNNLIKLGIYFSRKPKPIDKFSRIVQIIIRIIFQLDIKFSRELEIGKRTKFIHNGIGSVVHHKTKIGNNVMIYQGVTLGSNVFFKNGVKKNIGAPIIEDDVVIFSGAVIAGPIIIGKGSVIGANCVVTQNIPPLSIVKHNNCVYEEIKHEYSFNQIK